MSKIIIHSIKKATNKDIEEAVFPKRFPEIKKAKLESPCSYYPACEHEGCSEILQFEKDVEEERRTLKERDLVLAKCLSKEWDEWSKVPKEVQERFKEFLKQQPNLKAQKFLGQYGEEQWEDGEWWQANRGKYFFRANFVAFELRKMSDSNGNV